MKILVAIEESVFSDKALEWAVANAKAQHAKLSAISVAEDFNHFDELFPDMVDVVRATVEDQAKRTAERAKNYAEQQGLKIEAVVVRGQTAAEAIIDQAKTTGVDLLVLGSRGRKGLNRFVMGSVASRVVRHAPCSVTVVR